MLITGWVSSRIGAKRTLVAGLILIVVFAGLAGSSGTIGGIVGFRAGWGLGNALFIATSLAVIVSSATGGFGGAIILYETALGVGIASGPVLGGLLGSVSWRGPFYGVCVLMFIALMATIFLVPATPAPPQRSSLSEPIAALRHGPLAKTSVTGLLYNWGFFTILGYAPVLMRRPGPGQAASGAWAAGTASAGGGGGGGVPPPNGRPPSASRPCGSSQPARSGPSGTIPVGLMLRCTW
jgi:MFS family permease